MTLITITLEENEQDWLLKLAEPADNYTPHPVTTTVAEKVRRAQDTTPFEVHPPTTEDGNTRLEAERHMFRGCGCRMSCGNE